MKKGCKPYKVNSKNSYTSTKNFLLAKGLIDKFLNIIDYNNFKKEVASLTKLAKDKHGINEGPLFGERTISSADKSYYQAVANKTAFNKIDGVKKKAQPKQELADYYMGDDALREQEARETAEEPAYVDQVTAVTQKIEYDLPSEIAKSITVLNEVPLDILGRDDLFLSLKDILNDNGITDEILINWAGINKDILGHPKNIKSDKQLTSVIKTILDKKQKEDQYIEFKVNPLALKSFREWIKALEKYSPAFQERMLTHAIKYITNPTRKSKYVLQLSDVALTKAHGIVVNKPHELNRIGKLYDQEVLATVSDAVDHEPSASGKGYWVHVPRTKDAGIEHNISIRDISDNPKAPGKFIVEWMSAIDQDYEADFFETRQEAEEYASTLGRGTFTEDESKNYKKNVELLRKLSPSTWCTASSMTEHYVANYDNYLLIVDGVTVAGIEAIPKKDELDEIQNIKNKIKSLEQAGSYTIDRNRIKGTPSTFTSNIKSFEGEIINLRTNDRDEINIQEEEAFKKINEAFQRKIENLKKDIQNLTEKAKLQKVKEVTSRANNGMAPINHLDDVIAFFEKHNLDLDNQSINRAIKAKEAGKVDDDYSAADDDYEDIQWDAYVRHMEEQERIAIDRHNGEYEQEPDYDAIENDRYEEARRTVIAMSTVDDVAANRALAVEYFNLLDTELRKNKELATEAIDYDSHSISHIDSTLPFYNELAVKAVTKNPRVFVYLSEEKQNLPGLREIYDQAIARDQALLDDLPFSKTNTNQIQGYYDAKNDKVVVIASNTPINEASKVGIHEIAHRGMLRMAKDLGGVQELGKALFAAEDQLMKKLPELLKRTGHKSLESLMLDYGFVKTSKEGKIKLLMELAARWAETLVDKPKPAWWKELLQSIKNWITKFTGVVLNEEELDELVGGFVKYGTNQSAQTSSQNRDLFLHLSSELNDKLSFNNPGYNAGPTVQDLINQMPMITKADIDNKKLEC